MTKRAFIDCDGVLLDWCQGFAAWYQDVSECVIDPTGPGMGTMENWLQVHTHDEVIEHVEAFNFSDQFGQLRPVPKAIETMQELKRQGWAFTMLTACGIHTDVMVARRENVKEVFGRGVIDNFHFFDLGEAKTSFFESIPDEIVIEDDWRQAQRAADAGCKSILIRRPYNAHHHPEWDNGEGDPHPHVTGQNVHWVRSIGQLVSHPFFSQ